MCITWSPASELALRLRTPDPTGLPHTAPGPFQVAALLSSGALLSCQCSTASSVSVNTLFTAVLVPVLPFTLRESASASLRCGGGGFIDCGFMECSGDWRPWDTRLTAA